MSARHSRFSPVSVLTFMVLGIAALTRPAFAGWEVQWIDRFDGTGVDWSNWTAQVQANFNNEVQCYTDDDSSADRNYEVSGGTLKIIARKQSIPMPCLGLGGSLRSWFSGRLNSKDKREFLYGRIEARIRFHDLEGGTWPAFWMLENRIFEDPLAGDDDFITWPNPGAGEIDVWEWFANSPASYITNFFNTNGCGSEVRYTYPGGAAEVLQWHAYAIEWDANLIRFFVDDSLVASHDVSACPQYKEPMFVLLNVAVGGNLGGVIDPSLTRATMEVDYVAHCAVSGSNAATRCNESTPSATNTAPVITSSPSIETEFDQPYSYRLTAADSDGDALTLSATTIPPWLIFDADDALLSGTPMAADVGDHDVVLNVSDGFASVDQAFTITVLPANTPPTMTSPASVTAAVGEVFSYTLTGFDADGDALGLSVKVWPAWLTFDSASGVLSGTPTDLFIGSSLNQVTFEITDGRDVVDALLVISVSATRDSGASAGSSSGSSSIDVRFLLFLIALAASKKCWQRSDQARVSANRRISRNRF